jgi:hypothetical protein
VPKEAGKKFKLITGEGLEDPFQIKNKYLLARKMDVSYGRTVLCQPCTRQRGISTVFCRPSCLVSFRTLYQKKIDISYYIDERLGRVPRSISLSAPYQGGPEDLPKVEKMHHG